MGICSGISIKLLFICYSLNELEFRSVGFSGGRKSQEPLENPQRKDDNQQQTEPTYDAGSGNRTTTLVEVSTLTTVLSLLPLDLLFPKFAQERTGSMLALGLFCTDLAALNQYC